MLLFPLHAQDIEQRKLTFDLNTDSLVNRLGLRFILQADIVNVLPTVRTSHAFHCLPPKLMVSQQAVFPAYSGVGSKG